MDPIANMLTIMRNASAVFKETAEVPFSNVSFAIAECLVAKGFLSHASKKTGKNERYFLELKFSYPEGAPRIHELTRISKPSRRIYIGVRRLRPYKGGKGLYILSTPKGILSDKEAKKEQVGGEVLFSVW